MVDNEQYSTKFRIGLTNNNFERDELFYFKEMSSQSSASLSFNYFPNFFIFHYNIMTKEKKL